VPKKEIDELYLNSPYYLVPDGDVGQQAFAVIREAIRKEGMVALGRVVFTSREHVISLEARGKGLLGMTLRYPYEVRKEEEYFDDIPDEKIPKDMLELASHIVETKSGHFEPEKFEDQYEDALKELLNAPLSESWPLGRHVDLASAISAAARVAALFRRAAPHAFGQADDAGKLAADPAGNFQVVRHAASAHAVHADNLDPVAVDVAYLALLECRVLAARV
jgi:Ku protein